MSAAAPALCPEPWPRITTFGGGVSEMDKTVAVKDLLAWGYDEGGKSRQQRQDTAKVVSRLAGLPGRLAAPPRMNFRYKERKRSGGEG